MNNKDPVISQLPPPFSYFRLIYETDHLHFGLWPSDGASLTMESAQENMFETLVSFLPEPPAKILHVGCGLGLSAHLLNAKGYTVTAIAPSPELIYYATKQYGSSGVDFRGLDYFDKDDPISTEGSYDAVVFQESLQWFRPLATVMKKARNLLRGDGLIIVGDQVCYDKDLKPETAVYMSQEIYVVLAENGFRMMRHESVGKRVIHTCDFVADNLTNQFDHVVSAMDSPGTRETLESFLDRWKAQKDWYVSGQLGYEIFIGKKDPFLIRHYEAGDEHRILPLFNEVFKVDRTLDHWYWKFRDNPYGTHKVCIGLSEGGDLVSHYAGYPVPFCSTVGDRENPKWFVAIQVGDTFTHLKVRKRGLGKTGLLARTTYYHYAKFLEGLFPFAYGFNTGKIKELGERDLGYVFADPVLYRVKDLAGTPFKRPGPFSRVFSGFVFEEVLSVDDEWDDFFGRVTPSYGFLVRRDAAYLRWRYLECPDRVHRIFAVRRRGALVGWGVFTLKNQAVFWGDALFDKEYLGCVSYLLSHLVKRYFQDAKTIEGWFSKSPEWWNRHLDSIGFEANQEPNNLTLVYHTYYNKTLAADSVRDALFNHFYYTWGDSDLF